ncbi:hypothetical protein PAAG_12127 [Paracoccidioides lutzii Pb01]|uniref:Uncharacterized protein n=1 Tax=Paracoccidioides lutzii (strain ATCC MYA-826 / Pb01) TaxID=502779 RepID=A0A0A2V4D5_PARBA|nr:hypothetical protein PAAG_12127 [Paracoccidioides lutzii Pb01]KGQ01182.1 hypothetical protein PAAG_12127 [Paracoccidioides lutzii Pb01]
MTRARTATTSGYRRCEWMTGGGKYGGSPGTDRTLNWDKLAAFPDGDLLRGGGRAGGYWRMKMMMGGGAETRNEKRIKVFSHSNARVGGWVCRWNDIADSGSLGVAMVSQRLDAG